MNKLFAFLLNFLLVAGITSCNKLPDPVNPSDSDSDSPSTRTAQVCPVGTPVGVATTKAIGPEGGQLVADELGITITVPAGAVESMQTFSVQPIETTGPQGVGPGFRLSPHGTTFKKPVTISVQYDPQALVGSFPEALALAYQTDKGIYMMVANGKVDTTAHTVQAQTTHFSDWNLLERARLSPETGFVWPNRTLDLEVKLLTEEFTSPLPGEKEVLIPYEAPSMAVDYNSWKVMGGGKLAPNRGKATYTAPSTIPAKNPAAVTVRLKGPTVIDGKPFRELWLVANIYVGKEGLTYRINNGPWINTLPGTTIGGAVIMNETLMLSAGATIDGNNIGVSIITPRPNYEFGTMVYNPVDYQWSIGAQPTAFSLSDYSSGILYLHYYKQKVSPGMLHIRKSGPVGSWIIGDFVLEAAGILHPTKGFTGTAQIEGFFKLERKRE